MRKCRDCPASLEGTHRQRKRCEPCAHERKRQQYVKYRADRLSIGLCAYCKRMALKGGKECKKHKLYIQAYLEKAKRERRLASLNRKAGL